MNTAQVSQSGANSGVGIIQGMEDVERVRDIARTLETAATLGDTYEAKSLADRDGALMTELHGVLTSLPAAESQADTSPVGRMLLMSINQITTRYGITSTRHQGTLPSLEDVGQIIDALSSSSSSLQERSTEALEALLATLTKTVPDMFGRLEALNGKLANKNDAEQLGRVSLNDSQITDRLHVGGEIPVPLSKYVNEYVKYGQNLMTNYSTAAIHSVMQASVLQSGVDGGSVDGFWSSVEEKLARIPDPRAELTSTQLDLALPGCGALFGAEDAAPSDVLQIKAKLERFVSSRKPQGLNDQEYRKGEDQAVSREAFQISDMRDSIKYFMDLKDSLQLTAFGQSCKAAWMDIARTNEAIRKHLSSSDPSLLAALNGDGEVLNKYLDTLFGLAAWPALNYLTNLVLFGNAFADFAELSLDAKPEEQKPADATPENPEGAAAAAEPAADGEAASDSTVDVGDNREDGEKPNSPDEVPDTGATPDAPQDGTGEGERAVVEDVDKTIEAKGESEESPPADPAEPAAEGEEDTTVDVAAAEETEEGEEESDTAVDVAAKDDEDESEDDDKTE